MGEDHGWQQPDSHYHDHPDDDDELDALVPDAAAARDEKVSGVSWYTWCCWW